MVGWWHFGFTTSDGPDHRCTPVDGNAHAGSLIHRLKTKGNEMTRRTRSRSLTTMPNLRDIAVDSSLVMLAFLNTDAHRNRIKFGDPLSVAFKNDNIPKPLLNLLTYMIEEGVEIPDVFRRPGNTTEQKKLIKKLTDGKPVKYADYNFYTLASVIKRFLLSIPGGILGLELETKALTVLFIENTVQQLQTLNCIITCLPRSVQHLLALLFGLWYRIAQREHIHKMSAEAMAKSVTGSIFVNTTSDPKLVKNAAKVMELMIENFTWPILFGEENLQFFANTTSHSDLNNDEMSEGSHNTPNHIQGTVHLANTLDKNDKQTNLARYDEIKIRQLDRLKQRREWFLNTNRSVDSSPKASRRLHFTRGYLTRQTIDVIPRLRHIDHDSADDGSETSSDTGEDNT